MIKRTVFLVAIVILLTFSQASALDVGGVGMAEELLAGDARVFLNGAGIRKKFFVDVYACGLYTQHSMRDANAVIEADEPMLIRLEIIYGGITAEKMTEAFNEGFHNATNGNPGPLKDEIDAFNAFFPAKFTPGDTYDFIYIPQRQRIDVRINDNLEGSVPGLAFKKVLFAVWLGHKPADKKLKTRLLAARPMPEPEPMVQAPAPAAEPVPELESSPEPEPEPESVAMATPAPEKAAEPAPVPKVSKRVSPPAAPKAKPAKTSSKKVLKKPAAPASKPIVAPVRGPRFPEALTYAGKPLHLKGKAQRLWAGMSYFQIYKVGLYLPRDFKNPQLLVDSDADMILRVVMANRLRVATWKRIWNEDFKTLNIDPQSALGDKVRAFIGMFKEDAKKNKTYDFRYRSGDGTTLFINDDEIGTIPGLDFKQALFSLFIGPRAIGQEISKNLAGQ